MEQRRFSSHVDKWQPNKESRSKGVVITCPLAEAQKSKRRVTFIMEQNGGELKYNLDGADMGKLLVG